MKLSTFKAHLTHLNSLEFTLEDGTSVPAHFHITEAGLTTNHFIDCGGQIRTEKSINFQIWVANDTEHRLAPAKLLNIISIYENAIDKNDLDVEIEYQTSTVGKYGIDFQNGKFILTNTKTDCLAKDTCGIPKQKLKLADLTPAGEGCCTPGGGCC